MQAAISPEKRVVAWSHKVISPSIEATFSADYDRTKPDGTMLEATSEQAYEIENIQTAHVLAEIPVPLGYWRAVTSATLAFAHECFMDEMAVLAGQDPLEFRLAHLQKDSATRKIFLKLKEMSGHGKPKSSGSGLGFAQYDFFAGTAGAAVEVEKKTDNSLKIKQIWVAIDLGTVVNPDTVRSQIEGAVAMALTAATKNGITFEKGRAVQRNFHDNPMLRLPEMPPVEVHIFADGGEKIKGVGEPGLPPIAPALANAIFAATGRRIRRMPFDIA
jgi:isoquinoline 1-oxidoreductase subunit beta